MARSIEFVRCILNKIAKRSDCVSLEKGAILARSKFCNIMIDTVLAPE